MVGHALSGSGLEYAEELANTGFQVLPRADAITLTEFDQLWVAGLT